MPAILCPFQDRNYQLDYEKALLASGALYHGTLYLDKILDFYFEVFDNGEPTLFAPLNTADNLKKAIIGAITNFEQTPTSDPGKKPGKGFFGGVD